MNSLSSVSAQKTHDRLHQNDSQKDDAASNRHRFKSQSSILSFGSSNQRIRPYDVESDKFLRRFATNPEELNVDQGRKGDKVSIGS